MGVMVLREVGLALFPKSKLMIFGLFTLALPFSFSVLVRVSLGELYEGTICHSGYLSLSLSLSLFYLFLLAPSKIFSFRSDCVEVLIREGLLNMAPKYCAFCWVVIPSIIAGVVI